MGMTYRIVALPNDKTAEEWCEQTIDADLSDDSDLVESTDIVDDMVFDRENLAKWCGLEHEDWVDAGVAILKPCHVKRAKDVLQCLVDRVAAMPYTPDRPAMRITFDMENMCPCDRYEGSDENIAIRKEVEKVLLKPYHFNYPWQPDRPFGVPRMIKALDDVLAFMNANPNRVVMALYY